MTLVSWSPSISVNVSHFDEQHKELVNLINELHAGMLSSSAHEVMEDILNRLANYTLTHFKEEEEYMVKYNYPNYLEHKESHEKLAEQVKMIISKHKEGAKINKVVLSFLKNWLNEHIIGEDKELGTYLNTQNVF